VSRENGRDARQPRGQPPDDAGFGSVRMDDIRPHAAYQSDAIPERAQVLPRPHRLDQVRNDVTGNPKLPGCFGQVAALASANLEIHLTPQSTQEIDDMGLGSP
jgi:hypothetical protein